MQRRPRAICARGWNEAGMNVTVDAAGNLRGVYAGARADRRD